MHTMEALYVGELRCEATHLASGNVILSDAPVDNQGKGMAFSPTDLMTTSLALCMMTIMGIAAKEKGIHFEDVLVHITKIMGSNPRRVVEIHLDFHAPLDKWDEKETAIMKHAAETCPVAKSIHPDIKVKITWSQR